MSSLTWTGETRKKQKKLSLSSLYSKVVPFETRLCYSSVKIKNFLSFFEKTF